MEFFVFVSIVAGIASAIFWMIVGWRAMRAHERIAEVSEKWIYFRQEERIADLRDKVAQKQSASPSAEDTFTPKHDAPPELPWTKEL